MPFERNPDRSRSPDRKYVTALARGLAVLHCFGPGDRWLAHQEIAARTGLAKPTVARLTHTLLRTGYLQCSRLTNKLSFGNASRVLGFTSLAQMDVRRAARPVLQELAQHAHGTAELWVRDAMSMALVDRYYGMPVAFRADAGARIPIATSSVGRAYLFALSRREQRSLLQALRQANPSDWPVTRRALVDARAAFRDAGFTTSTAEWRRDLVVVAVPLVFSDALEPMVFSFTGASFDSDAATLQNEVAPRLLMLAGSIRAALEAA